MRSIILRVFLTVSPLLLAFGAPSDAAVLRLWSDAPASASDGQTWETAFRDWDSLMAAARDNDEVWVAKGVYGSITVTRPLSIYGGFSGTETLRSQSDPRRNVARFIGGDSPAITFQQWGILTLEGVTIASSDIGIRAGAATLRSVVIEGCRVGVFHGLVTTSECEFRQNGTAIVASTPFTLTANTFVGNTVGVQSQISWASTPSLLLRNRFTANGTAVQFSSHGSTATLQVLGNEFWKNNQGVVIPGVSGPYVPQVVVVNNTFVENRVGSAIVPDAAPVYQNNIFASNETAVSGYLSARSRIVNSCFYGNGSDYDGTPVLVDNLHEDPLLADPATGNLHIQPDSPCRDSGLASVTGYQDRDLLTVTPDWLDVDGDSRILGPRVDIGADESNGTVWPSASAPHVVYVRPGGDDDRDGSSWAAAKRTLQAATTEAALRSAEVWIAAGVYPGNISVFSGISLYGGFAGTETRRDQRNPALRSTVSGSDPVAPTLDVEHGRTPVTLDSLALNGGGTGIFLKTPMARVVNCRFTGAEIGLSVREAAEINGCDFRGNLTGLLFRGYTSASLAASARVTNAVFAGNGVGVRTVLAASPSLTNNTFLANTTALWVQDTATVSATNNLIAHNRTGVRRDGDAASVTMRTNGLWENLHASRNAGNFLGANGNFEADPKIASLALGDVRLQSGSPMIDAGDDTVDVSAADFGGQPRRQGARIDIGADEADGTVHAPQPARIRVRPDGDDANDGAAWATAKRTLPAALDAASATGGEVWAAGGTYAVNTQLPAFVSLYGGFRGTEASRAERTSGQAETVLEPVDDAEPTLRAFTGLSTSVMDSLTFRNGGYGLYMEAASPAVTNSRFTGNEVALYAAFHSWPDISDCGLWDNGTAILCDDESHASISRSDMRRNETGVYAAVSAPVVANSLIVEGGTGIEAVWDAAPAVVNTTIARNAIGVALRRFTRPSVLNSIVAQNAHGFLADTTAHEPTIMATTVAEQTEVNFDGIPNVIGFHGNIGATPMFLDAANGNYRLGPASPARDAGNDAFVVGDKDLDGNPRRVGSAVDMGAYEQQGPPGPLRQAVMALKIVGGLLPASQPDAAALDTDGDGAVTLHDVLVFCRAANAGG